MLVLRSNTIIVLLLYFYLIMVCFFENSFAVIKLNRYEASQCGFGRENIETIVTHLNDIDCHHCSNEIDAEDDMYYIPQLKQLLCWKCYKDTIKNVKHSSSPSDLMEEELNFNKTMRKLHSACRVKAINGVLKMCNLL